MAQINFENAKIADVSFSMADHGCITFWVFIETAEGSCSIGGYCIGHGYVGANDFTGYGEGIEAMARIMNVVGVERWEDLKGQYCRVEPDESTGRILKIGNIIKEKWFDIDEFFIDEFFKEEK